MAKGKSQNFKDAALATPEVKDCYREGLKALGSHSSKVELSNDRKAEGSIEIDAPFGRRKNRNGAERQSLYFGKP